jgi:hypothetical protein
MNKAKPPCPLPNYYGEKIKKDKTDEAFSSITGITIKT